jgi:hypothetical protein
MSWSITAKGAPSHVLESLDTQAKAIILNIEKNAEKDGNYIKTHLEALMHFFSSKLSNTGSAGHVEVTAVGHKAEGMVHELDLKIKHVEPPKAAEPKVETPVPPKAPEAPSAKANG